MKKNNLNLNNIFIVLVIVYILVLYVFWFSFQQNITVRTVTIRISTIFRGVALIRGGAFIRERRLFQCGYPKSATLIRGRRLFETRRSLEEIRYARSKSKTGSSHRRCSVKKGVLKKIANFIGKHLCWSFFLIKLQA